MTETWIQIIFSGLLAWIAWELRSIKKELKTFVLREDCRDDMRGHCDRINKLEGKLDHAVSELEKLKGNAEVWHTQSK
jgi:hypothetical protein